MIKHNDSDREWYLVTMRSTPMCEQSPCKIYATRLTDATSFILCRSGIWGLDVQRERLKALTESFERVRDTATLQRLNRALDMWYCHNNPTPSQNRSESAGRSHAGNRAG